MTEKTLGITVSRHQGEMDFEKAYRAGARFALIRAGSIDSLTGKCYTDYQFERNAEIAPRLMPVGFFWFYRPQFSPTMQMDYFCNLIASATNHLPPTLDVEVALGPRPRYSLASCVKTTLDCIEGFTAVNGKSRRPMIYTRAEFWNRLIGLVYWAKDYRLWLARYTGDQHPWKNAAGKTLSKVKPKGWEDWTFWQWSADGNGRGFEFGSPKVNGSDSICLEWFNGSEQDLARFCGTGQVPAPPNPPQPPLEKGESWKEAIDAWARTKGYVGPKPGP